MPIEKLLRKLFMKRFKLKKTMMTILIILATFTLIIFAFMQQASFGALPKGDRLEKITQSANFKKGQFHNVEHTPDLTEGYGFFSVLYEFLFMKTENTSPTGTIPSTKTNIKHLNNSDDALIWFGHSSYYIQIDGKSILVDPVFSGNSSPIPNNIKAFNGTDQYTPNDFDEIDYLFITHDHWDHLDYKTVLALKNKVKTVICGLGVGQHFEKWGYEANKIKELDWNESITVDNNFIVDAVSSRHFSGRGIHRNKTLWVSFVIQTPSFQLFIGGDSGYGVHFANIGNKYGEFDLVILENGQYDKKWKYIHMMPEEVLQAAKDLKAKRLFPVHSGKFKLANHAWDEPLIRITKANKTNNLNLLTPIIGQQVYLKDTNQIFSEWWLEVK